MLLLGFIRDKKWKFPVQLCKELEFNGDLVINFYNRKEGGFFKKSTANEHIGSIAFKLINLLESTKKVQIQVEKRDYYMEYFNISKNGKANGRVLASFYLDPAEEEKEGEKGFTLGEGIDTRKDEEGLTQARLAQQETEKCKIHIAVLGLRYLPKAPSDPILTFKLTNSDKEHALKPNEARLAGVEKTSNPNFLDIVDIDCDLYDNAIDWPYLQVKFSDPGLFGCQSGYTTLLLFPYATDFLSPKIISCTRAIFNNMQKDEKMQQYQGTTKKGSSRYGSLSSRSIISQSGSHRSSKEESLGKISEISEENEEEEAKDQERKAVVEAPKGTKVNEVKLEVIKEEDPEKAYEEAKKKTAEKVEDNPVNITCSYRKNRDKAN